MDSDPLARRSLARNPVYRAATKLQAAVRGLLQRLVWPFRRALILAEKGGFPLPLPGDIDKL